MMPWPIGLSDVACPSGSASKTLAMLCCLPYAHVSSALARAHLRTDAPPPGGHTRSVRLYLREIAVSCRQYEYCANPANSADYP